MSQADRPVIPNVFLPKALGITHVVYGILLTLFSLGWGLYVMGLPALMEFGGQQAASGVAKQIERNRENLREIDAKIEAVAEGDGKEALIEQRLEFQVNEEFPPEAPKFRTLGLTSTAVIGTFGFEVSTGIFLYFLMFIAGIGLFLLRRWARWLALMVAALKLAQVLVVGGLLAFAAAPALSDGVREQMDAWQKEEAERLAKEPAEGEAETKPAPAPRMTPAEMGDSVRKFMMAHAAGTVVFGALYPIITLAILNQRSVRLAFERNRKGQAQAEVR